VHKTADVDKAQRESADAVRQADAESRAESAAGIGQTEEESQAGDRDADGRRLWERPAENKGGPSPDASEETQPESPIAKDPTGECGQSLDITG
jgi:hypothetical protein